MPLKKRESKINLIMGKIEAYAYGNTKTPGTPHRKKVYLLIPKQPFSKGKKSVMILTH
jgi:hypothetical protein